MRPHGSLRGLHQGAEGRWEAMRALSSRPFCSCNGRRVSPRYLSALGRYTTSLCPRVMFVTGDALGVDSTAFLAQCGQPYLYKPCTVAAVRRTIQQTLHAMEVSV